MTDQHLPEDISSVLRSRISGFSPSLTREQVGRVTEAGDGIARVSGLPGVMANELLDFGIDPSTGQSLFGLALNLDEHTIGAVIFGDASTIEEGDEVKPTGEVLSSPWVTPTSVASSTPSGRPIDGKGPLDEQDRRSPWPRGPGPGVVDRQPVHEPLQTGIKAIDAMTPIGRGQRQLIIGDRQTGKTAVAVDTIINQRETTGPPATAKAGQVHLRRGRPEGLDGRGGRQQARAERRDGVHRRRLRAGLEPGAVPVHRPLRRRRDRAYWMYNGEHALGLRRPVEAGRRLPPAVAAAAPPAGPRGVPRRRLLPPLPPARARAKLSDELGAGSLTALPIIETKGGDVSAYIPTNVISITDGQIYLETDLFFQGVRPAINVGISVSRVGGSAQVKGMKKVAGTMRIDLAQYRELEAFAQFGSELDKASQAQLDRGVRTVEILKQPQYAPVPVEEQIVIIWAVGNGKLDDVPVPDVRRFEAELREYFASRHSSLLDGLRSDGQLTDERVAELESAVDAFNAAVPAQSGRGGRGARHARGPRHPERRGRPRRPDVGRRRLRRGAAARRRGPRPHHLGRTNRVSERLTPWQEPESSGSSGGGSAASSRRRRSRARWSSSPRAASPRPATRSRPRAPTRR
jgi:F-type H+/Na+-transporting ATPase subunit alpha